MRSWRPAPQAPSDLLKKWPKLPVRRAASSYAAVPVGMRPVRIQLLPTVPEMIGSSTMLSIHRGHTTWRPTHGDVRCYWIKSHTWTAGHILQTASPQTTNGRAPSSESWTDHTPDARIAAHRG